jgi:hypothetical protein
MCVEVYDKERSEVIEINRHNEGVKDNVEAMFVRVTGVVESETKKHNDIISTAKEKTLPLLSLLLFRFNNCVRDVVVTSSSLSRI